MDQAWGYWQIPIEEKSKEKTAFVTYNGLYEFNVLPFGLCNAPATFQRLMNLLLADLQWEKCLVYLDDILIFSETFDEHLERLTLVFTKIKQAGLKLREEKCNFALSHTNYLGYVASIKWREPNPNKIESVRNFPRPTDVTKVKSFLGLCSYYRRYIRNFVQIVEPLNSLPKKNSRFRWSEEQEMAFNELKKALCEATLLVYPNYNLPFLLQTDASGQGIAAILAQENNEQEYPIAFASRAMRDADKNYPVFEQEALAIVWGYSQFHTYLLQAITIVVTDHAALQYISKAGKITHKCGCPI